MNTIDQMGIQRWRLRPALRPETADSQDEVDLNEESSSTVDIASIVDVDSIQQVSADPHARLDWQGLQSKIDDNLNCPSCGSSNSLLGSGDMNAAWMFVIDAPSTSDVQQHQILTGRVGKLFEAVLLALELDRSSVYVSSVFKCAPTDDLSVTPSCNKLLHRQIELIQPRVVVTFGEFAAQAVIKANESLETLRQQNQQCFSTNVAIVPTFSPSQMLDDPSLKAHVWADLKKCLSLVRA